MAGGGPGGPPGRGAPEATGNPVCNGAAQVAAAWPFALGLNPEFELASGTVGKGPHSPPCTPLFYPIYETSSGEIFLSLTESLFLCGAEGASSPDRARGARAGASWGGGDTAPAGQIPGDTAMRRRTGQDRFRGPCQNAASVLQSFRCQNKQGPPRLARGRFPIKGPASDTQNLPEERLRPRS